MSRLPLYENYENNLKGGRPPKGNTGLWYNKFCNTWRRDIWSLKTPPGNNTRGPKQVWMSAVANGHKVGDNKQLQDNAQRQKELVTAMGGSHVTLQTASSLVTGLGNSHPVENGFTWHHLLGTPYLPASSVKGLVRDWAENWIGGNDPDIDKIFGTQTATGDILFLDALPTETVKLTVEVITPHYGDYYKSDSADPVVPGDWLSPVPIPFLAVAPGAKIQFGPISRHQSEQCDELIRKTRQWLEDGLTTIGIGAKTATGLGLFKKILDTEDRWREELQNMSSKTLSLKFGKNWNKTKAVLGDDLPRYIELVKEICGDRVASWENSTNKNEEKTYKRVYHPQD